MTEKVKRGRGRPRKNPDAEKINVEKTMTEELLPVKIIYRALAKNTMMDNEFGWTTATVENYIAGFYPEYKLLDTHYAGQDPNAIYLVFVLVLNA